MGIKSKKYEVFQYDQHGDGTRVWYAQWDGGDSIVVYLGTVSEDEILVKRLQRISVMQAKNMRANQFHSSVSEFIESMLELEKVTGQAWGEKK